MKKIIIVGGVAGGSSTAARLRRLCEKDHIILFEKNEYISFANCGLPYYIGDVIPERKNLFVQTAEAMKKRFNIDVRIKSEVLSIDRKNKTILVKNINTNETYRETYDKLVLSPGANPLIPPLSGLENAKNIYTLRNIEDTDKIKSCTINIKKALIVGGGFIGIEMAENLARIGIDVSIVEKLPQVMAPFDFEMSSILHNELRKNGINLMLGVGITGFENEGKTALLDNGSKIETDMTILSIGVRPDTKLAKECSLEIGATGAIKVDKFLRTSDKDIYAIGDAIETANIVSGKKVTAPLASPANRQGRMVADHINGKKIDYKGVIATSVAKVFAFTAASTGLNEKTCRQNNIKYKAVHIHRSNHASYYPNAKDIAMKLIFTPDGKRILGAQAIGGDGTEKRIDVISTAIFGGLSVWNLAQLELSYAPPYSSAKDPVNILGYVASNICEGMYDVVHYDEIKKLGRDVMLLDVRGERECSRGMIEGSININLETLRQRLHELDKNKEIVVICQVGFRGYLALNILKQNGFEKVKNLSGGYKTYSDVYGN